jgi:hypothetical protein
MPWPAVGTARWREVRPAWFALLIVVLVPMVIAVMRAERPMIRLPAGLGTPGPWSRVLLVAGLAASMLGLARLAIAGFAPGGQPPALARPPARPAAAAERSLNQNPGAGPTWPSPAGWCGGGRRCRRASGARPGYASGGPPGGHWLLAVVPGCAAGRLWGWLEAVVVPRPTGPSRSGRVRVARTGRIDSG